MSIPMVTVEPHDLPNAEFGLDWSAANQAVLDMFMAFAPEHASIALKAGRAVCDAIVVAAPRITPMQSHEVDLAALGQSPDLRFLKQCRLTMTTALTQASLVVAQAVLTHGGEANVAAGRAGMHIVIRVRPDGQVLVQHQALS